MKNKNKKRLFRLLVGAIVVGFLVAGTVVMWAALAGAGQICTVKDKAALGFDSVPTMLAVGNKALSHETRFNLAKGLLIEGKLVVIPHGTRLLRVESKPEWPADKYVLIEGDQGWWVLKAQLNCGERNAKNE